MPELQLKRGEVVRAEGLVSLQVKEGGVSIVGGLHERGAKVVIPKAKSLPVEAESDAVIEYTAGPGGAIERLPGRTIPPEWDELVGEIARIKPRVVLILGEVDTGKSFFTTYVANTMLRQNLRVAVIDGDVGQSDVGPPTTLGIGVIEKPVAILQEVQPEAAYFVGSMSPSGHMLEFMVGMKRMVEHGLQRADVTVVNTAGWTTGGPGRALRLYEMELLNPDLVVALQRGKELEHLLKSVSPGKVRRLTMSKQVRPRSKSDRTFLRELYLARYFEGAGRLTLDLRKVSLERCYYRTGEPLDPKGLGVAPIVYAEKIPEGLLVVVDGELSQDVVRELEAKFGNVHVTPLGSEKNVAVGLADANDELVGLGIIDKIDYARERLVVVTPVKDVSQVSVVQFGSMRISPKGKEIGTVKPGSF